MSILVVFVQKCLLCWISSSKCNCVVGIEANFKLSSLIFFHFYFVWCCFSLKSISETMRATWKINYLLRLMTSTAHVTFQCIRFIQLQFRFICSLIWHFPLRFILYNFNGCHACLRQSQRKYTKFAWWINETTNFCL